MLDEPDLDVEACNSKGDQSKGHKVRRCERGGQESLPIELGKAEKGGEEAIGGTQIQTW